jgi:putative transposase
MEISFARHQFPPDIIRHAVWLDVRFALSFRDVEDLRAERGLDVSYETLRQWVLRFGPLFAKELRRRRHRPTSHWHLDEMAVLIAGRRFWLWRAVDDEGEVLYLLVQRRRDKTAAVKLRRNLLKKRGFASETCWVLMSQAKSELRLTPATSRVCGEPIGPRIRTCRFVDATERCSGSNRPDQRNGSYPSML